MYFVNVDQANTKFQAVKLSVLLFFYRDLRNQSQLADKELTRTLQSLVDVKILCKNPKKVFSIRKFVS